MTVETKFQTDQEINSSTRDGNPVATPTGIRVRDRRFLKEIHKLSLLRSFATREVGLRDIERPQTIGSLVQLRYLPWGRLPLKEEWEEIDRLTSALFAQLSEPLRKKFARSQVAPFIAYVPVFFLLVACIGLVLTVDQLAEAQKSIFESEFKKDPAYIDARKQYAADLKELQKQVDTAVDGKEKERLEGLLENKSDDHVFALRGMREDFIKDHKEIKTITYGRLMANATVFQSSGTIILYYLGWLVSMGCIGAVAFIGMNAISAQDDITFDISNIRLMILRVVLGGLFALVLTLPFGSESFIDFCYFIGTGENLGGQAGQTAAGESSIARVLMLTAPFLLGFSTSLVILILNQLIDGVQAFFGKKSSPGHTAEQAESSRLLPPDAGAKRDTAAMQAS
ncbi:MAG TPA: hypothetical protein VGM32_24765 [Rhodopila sp.]